MPMVRAKTLCYVDSTIRKPGEEFAYNGPENTNLEVIGSGSEDDEVNEKAPSNRSRSPSAKTSKEADKG